MSTRSTSSSRSTPEVRLRRIDWDRMPQDCGCRTHAGPHFIHMDRMDQRSNRRLRRDTFLGLLAYSREEAERLRRLRWGWQAYMRWFRERAA